MGRGEQILLVDDELAILQITKGTLESFNYRVLTARDGVEAVTIYRQRKGEVVAVVTDWMMPLMDGPSLVRALRQIDPAIRILAISGLGPESNVADPRRLNVQGFISKPYSTEALLSALRDVLSAPR
jgi:CheY-like chemotaxis protein